MTHDEAALNFSELAERYAQALNAVDEAEERLAEAKSYRDDVEADMEAANEVLNNWDFEDGEGDDE